MANCNTQQLNITCGTDVVLHDRLIFDGETFDPNLSVGIAANLVSSLGKRTGLNVQVVDDELLISVPWVDGTLPGCYGLEVTGSCNSKKWATYADSLIKYTKATRIGVSVVAVESDSYDITQEVGYCYSDSPVTFAEVTVDEGYGTPSVDVEYEQRKLSMAFHNLKGNGIANVEQTTTSTEDGGVNETTITMDNGGTIVMQVRNGRTGGTGPKGNTGDSAIFDPSTGNISTMKQTTGDDALSPMSQKAVTDELRSQYFINAAYKFIDGAAILVSNGETKSGTAASADSTYTDYIDISNYSVISVPLIKTSTSFGYALYDDDYQFISGGAVDTIATESGFIYRTVVTNGAKYIRYTVHRDTSSYWDGTLPKLYYLQTVKNDISHLLSEIEDVAKEDYTGVFEDINWEEFSRLTFYINSDGVWTKVSSTSSSSCFVIPIDTTAIRFTPRLDGNDSPLNYQIMFLSDNNNITSGYSAKIVGGSALFITPESADEIIMYVPRSAKYMYVRYNIGGTTIMPLNMATCLSVSNAFNKTTEQMVYVDAIKGSILRNAIFNPLYETLTPAEGDTYNCYYRISHPEDIFQANSSYKYRLTYFPRYIVCGGTLRITSTGLNNIVLFELPMRDLSLSPMDCDYKFSEIINKTSFPAGIAGTYEVELDSKTRRVAFVMGSTQAELTSPSDITNNITSVTLPLLSYNDFTFTSEESYSDEKTLVKQTKHGNSEVQSLGLIHYSDLHGDDVAVGHLIKAVKRHSSYVDDVLATGDVVHWYANSTTAYPQGSEWWKECGLSEISLLVLGNHDCATSAATEYDVVDGGAAWDGKGKQWAFDAYFADYKDSLGITLPTGYDDSTSPNYKACFWHKDYDEQKIRLIGLDCIHRFDGVVDPATGAITSAGYHYLSNEQELWLIARLNETLTGSGNTAEGYSVVFANHYPLDDYSENGQSGGRVIDHKTGDVVNWHWCMNTSINADRRFNNRNRVATSSSFTKGTVNNFGNIINAWVANGGKFVVWLCGHYHNDFFYYPEDYPELLNIAVNQTGYLRGGSVADKSGIEYDRMSANFISIDTERGLIKIVRLGQKYNTRMIPLNVICYDYINKKVISEW